MTASEVSQRWPDKQLVQIGLVHFRLGMWPLAGPTSSVAGHTPKSAKAAVVRLDGGGAHSVRWLQNGRWIWEETEEGMKMIKIQRVKFSKN